MSSDARISPAIRFQIEQFVEAVCLAAKLDSDAHFKELVNLRSDVEERVERGIDPHGMNLSEPEALRRALESFGSVESAARSLRKPLLFRFLFHERLRVARLFIVVIQPLFAYLMWSAIWIENWLQHAPGLEDDFSLTTPTTNTIELVDQAANIALSRAVLARHTVGLFGYGLHFLMWLVCLAAIAFCNSASGRERLGRLSKIKWLFSLYLFWIWSMVFLFSLASLVFRLSDQTPLEVCTKLNAVCLVLLSCLSLLSILVELGLRENLRRNFWWLKSMARRVWEPRWRKGETR